MMSPIQKQRGAILVMGTLILVILIGIAAFALDLGRFYVLRAEMQNAVDAAAISAATELDGEAGARDRAMNSANQEMLNHLAHFSKQSELLDNLQPEDFTFYTWIGSNSDSSDQPSDCVVIDNGKCQATGDDDASYVKIKLAPVDSNDGSYTIDLFFLPVLSLFTTEPVSTTASTQVEALAGSESKVCNYPPMFICDPAEFGSPLTPGQMVSLHEQGPGSPWGNGTFGWLAPTKDLNDADPNDDSLTSNKLLAYRLGSIYGQMCSSTIEIKGGQIAQWPRWGLNTRFGLYNRPEHESEFFPSAPNVVDYPRDDNLTLLESGECGASTERFGNTQWLSTECADQPTTFAKTDYNSHYHEGGVVPAMDSRLEYYNWELDPLVNLPVNNMAVTDLHDDELQCDDTSKDKACRMLDGDPRSLESVPDTIDDDDLYKRRELFVGSIACAANDVGAGDEFNIEEAGVKWMRFFLTEHVSPPSGSEGVTIHAEFIEEVTDIEDEHFKKVIQLYE
ncbi:MAG: pilus assembly protein TadG-related protein [Pseudomonadota bacterium]|nr:pilus assembly protein TadG-related protein [Pseudomonadota bacterium]